MDFTQLICENDYIDYTLLQLINCFDKLEAEAFERLNGFFARMHDSVMVRRSSFVQLEDRESVFYGFSFDEPETPKTVNGSNAGIAELMKEKLARLENEMTEKTEKEKAFIECVKTLIRIFPFVTPDELYHLNELFDWVQLFGYNFSSEHKDDKERPFYFLYKKNNA